MSDRRKMVDMGVSESYNKGRFNFVVVLGKTHDNKETLY